ncbi:hypothetical protein Bcav_0954 [Beutenbergia cavernae DSM 12333]|uniref:Uncharacterized protein n=1 Tax=Beutenbergia cavernae (strain ATCC BAA-8 / DSM 12333 / CCUG 43141 / JCM 11478 / NBRC 16432 / NCIMB 13614 / HKI 0122) TaxID=471853 RepID=C5C029_BEUC1|nr:hypothetical protein [Beutenbergia cavernae]ACQ79215.1 hypothetical protein Bcav_0954 [Beutenbergia cavernae DSM 12333]
MSASTAVSPRVGHGAVPQAGPTAGGNLTAAVLAAACGAGVLLTLLRDEILPARYSYDELKIQQIAQGYGGFAEDRSFHLVGTLYRLLGLADSPALAGVLGVLAFFAVVLLAGRGWLTRPVRVLDVAVVTGALLLGSLYLGHFSKDVFVLPVVALAVSRLRGMRGELLLVAAMVGYGVGFRSYWLLVAALYVAARCALALRPRLSTLVVGSLVALGVLAVAFHVLYGWRLDHFRTAVNVGRLDGVDAATMITPAFGLGGVAGGWLDVVVVLVSFVVPVLLAAKGGALYLAASAYLAVMWWTVAARSARGLRAPRRDERVVRVLALLVAFTLVQSMFEPDYGSYLRHLAPLLPAVVFLVVNRATAQPASPGAARLAESGRSR